MTTSAAAPSATLAHRQIQVVYIGLMLAMLVASLDQTIVATALPTIVGSLGGFAGLSHLAWVSTAYLVTSTAAAVLFGKLSDLHDRKRTFQTALIVFLAGSVLAGAARSLDQLIAFRALQGVGGGGLMALTSAVVADMVPPRQRGRYVGYLGGILALATVAGPLLGGFFVDHLTWRWIFYVNIPLGVAAFVVIGTVLHLPPKPHSGRRMDYPGAALLVAAVSGAVLVASWGGTEHPWGSPLILGLAGATALALSAFILVERRIQRGGGSPLLPLDLFANPVIAVTSAVGVIAGLVLFGSILFLPLFLQVAKGASATSSGLLLAPLMVGVLAATITSGRLITRYGHYKPFPVIGTALMTVAFWLLSLLHPSTPRVAVVGEMLLLGAGIGMLMQVLILASQNAVQVRDLGLVTSLAQFFRELGGTFGVALFGAVFAARLGAELARRLPTTSASGLAATLHGAPAQLRQLPPAAHQAVVAAVSHAVDSVFVWAIPFTAAAFILSLSLRELPLRGTDDAFAALGHAGEPRAALTPERDQPA
jgi:EmrB/QacA subfamily drug resistance transporter